MFDAKRWIEAHEPPVYIARDGTEHRGRLWSHPEYLKWLDTFRSWMKTPLSDQEYEAELRRLLSSMAFSDAVVDEMIKLPSVALEEMVAGFFVLQRAGKKSSVQSSENSTPEPPPPLNPAPTNPTKIEPASESSAS